MEFDSTHFVDFQTPGSRRFPSPWIFSPDAGLGQGRAGPRPPRSSIRRTEWLGSPSRNRISPASISRSWRYSGLGLGAWCADDAVARSIPAEAPEVKDAARDGSQRVDRAISSAAPDRIQRDVFGITVTREKRSARHDLPWTTRARSCVPRVPRRRARGLPPSGCAPARRAGR